MQRQEHSLAAATYSKGTAGGHDSCNSSCTERKLFRGIEVEPEATGEQ